MTTKALKRKRPKKIIVQKKSVPALPFLEALTGGRLTLGETIQAIRQCDEIKQSDFAKKLGVSKSYLCDLEKNRKEVSLKKAVEFAKILEYSEEFFVQLALEDMFERQGLHFELKVSKAA